MQYKNNFDKWNTYDDLNKDMRAELDLIANNEDELKEHFGAQLEFGTGGLRGIMGVGCNRINIYTIRKATQGLANYINNTQGFKNNSYEKSHAKNVKSVAIAYDSRNNSQIFAKEAGCVLAANGIKAYVFDSLRPTPMLSYAVRELNCDGGIVITASHNPPKYNGYKVYDEYGGQITLKKANAIIREIEKLDIFSDVKIEDYDKVISDGMFEYISESIDEKYYHNVVDLVKNNNIGVETISAQKSGKSSTSLQSNIRNQIKIVYTPIHGTGAIPVDTVLQKIGYINVSVVESQREPNGNFPTVESPNPEEKSALKLAIELADEIKADLVLATDPDADRVGVATRDKSGELKLLNGNQIGVLLTEYIFSQKLYKQWYGENFDIADGVLIKTIVTSDLGANIARAYGARVMETLTGFKYIGEKIKEMEADNSGKFLFGYEESYGYLAGTFVRDKDAVLSSALISEMSTYYKSKGMTLFDALDMIYKKYGYYSEKLISRTFEGLKGREKIDRLMAQFCDIKTVTEIFEGVRTVENYNLSERYRVDEYGNFKDDIEVIELPKTNAIKCIFDDGSWLAVRPSGTEPKIKIYISALGNEFNFSQNRLNQLSNIISTFLK